jgi:deoxyuridine 5'-triphosphate nucleotidohydrolase
MIKMFNEIPEFKDDNLIQEYDTDAGYDIRAGEAVWLFNGQSANIKTGLHIAMPAYLQCVIKGRSGLALNQHVECSNAGVIDAGYRGEIIVKLTNHGIDPVNIAFGQRIAQAVFSLRPAGFLRWIPNEPELRPLVSLTLLKKKCLKRLNEPELSPLLSSFRNETSLIQSDPEPFIIEVPELEDLGDSERNQNGIGSTGQ